MHGFNSALIDPIARVQSIKKTEVEVEAVEVVEVVEEAIGVKDAEEGAEADIEILKNNSFILILISFIILIYFFKLKVKINFFFNIVIILYKN